jgi:hypothetical protein
MELLNHRRLAMIDERRMVIVNSFSTGEKPSGERPPAKVREALRPMLISAALADGVWP